MSLREHILCAIDEQHLDPKPTWVFVLRNSILWTASVLFLLFGGIAISIVLYAIDTNDWDVYAHMTDSVLSFVLLTLPHAWLLCFVLVVVVLHAALRHTKHGYRRTAHAIGFVIMSASFVLGIVFYQVGFGEQLHVLFSDRIGLYRQFAHPRLQRWQQPERGFLAGTVDHVSSTKEFQIVSHGGDVWHVTVASSSVVHDGVLHEQVHIRLIGEMNAQQTFEAERVLPWFRKNTMRKPKFHPHERKFRRARIIQHAGHARE